MRALIIDADATSRTDLKTILKGLAHCEEAGDRETALTLFREALAAGSPYRLVALEMIRINEVLGSLRDELRDIEAQSAVPPERQTCIIAVTPLTRRQSITDLLMQGFDEVITKPFDAKVIRSKLQLIDFTSDSNLPEGGAVAEDARVSTAKILDTISHRLKRGDLSLPPAPKVALRLMQLITSNAEIETVISLLKQDPTIAAKLIGVSNSAYYRGRTENRTIDEAIHWLGLTRTREMVMSICCRGYFVTNHPAYKQLVEDLWWHSLACAHAAELVIQKQGRTIDEDVFTLGLLHDIGKLFMIQVTADLRQPKKSKRHIKINELLVMMAAHHERFGASVLKKLGYPETFTALVRHHHRSEADPAASPALQVLQLADQLAKVAGFRLEPEIDSELSALLETQGYTVEMQTEMTDQIKAHLDQLRYLFG